jgi:N-acetylmuramoyl-L-alanine amidase
MVTLDNGVVIDESLTAVNQTAAADVPTVFKCGPREVLYFTIHHWDDKMGMDFDIVTNGLAGNNARVVSAHYTAEAARVSCLVSPDNAAWHAGNPLGNAKSVGIECRPEAGDDDYATVAALIRFLRGIYGDVPLVPHNYWFNTACPGTWDLVKLDKLARNVTTLTTDQQFMLDLVGSI